MRKTIIPTAVALMLSAPWCWAGPEASAPTNTFAAEDATDPQQALVAVKAEITKAKERLATLIPARQTWKRIASWDAGAGTALDVARHGKAVASIDDERNLRVYEVGRVRPRFAQSRMGFEGFLSCAAPVLFSPDGTRMAVIQEHKTLVLDAATGKTVSGPADMLLFNWLPDGKGLLGYNSWRMVLWRPPFAERPAEKEHGQNITAYDVRPDRSQMATLCVYGHVKRYAADGAELGDTAIRGKRGADVGYVAGGKLLAVAGQEDSGIELVDAETGARVATLRAHRAPVYALAAVGDGARFVSVDRNGEIRLWDVASRRCLDVTRCSADWFTHPAAAFKYVGQPDETTRCVPQAGTGLIRIDHGLGTVLLDMATLHPVAFLPNEGSTYSPRQSALDPIGRFLAARGGAHGEIILWKREE